jgi:hypothetical protein
LRFATAIPPAVVPEPSSSRLVLVVEVDSAHGTALVMLTTNEIEMASDQDFALPAEQVGLPFPISVQSDLVGAVWISQLENPIASVSDKTLHALVAFRHGHPQGTCFPVKGCRSTVRRIHGGSSSFRSSGRSRRSRPLAPRMCSRSGTSAR